MKKAFPLALIVLGLVFMVASAYTIGRGYDAKNLVRDELVAQNIVTPDDASIPGVRVDSVKTAQSMANIIEKHALESTGGLTYAEMGRFATPDGDPAGTSDETKALVGADGRPVQNPLRNVAFQSATLQTSLYTSIMAFNVADLVMGLGLMIGVLGLAVGGLGVALGGLVMPSLAKKLHVEPVLANTTH